MSKALTEAAAAVEASMPDINPTPIALLQGCRDEEGWLDSTGGCREQAGELNDAGATGKGGGLPTICAQLLWVRTAAAAALSLYHHRC